MWIVTWLTYLLNEPRRCRWQQSQLRHRNPWRVAWTRQVWTWTGVRYNSQNSAPAVCRLQRTNHVKPRRSERQTGTKSQKKNRPCPPRTSHVFADARLPPLHGDQRRVRSFSSHKSFLSERQPHVVRGGFDEGERHKTETPVLKLKPGILGHCYLFTHLHDQFPGETWWEEIQNTEHDSESYHVAEHACCSQIHQQFVEKHICSLVDRIPSSWRRLSWQLDW